MNTAAGRRPGLGVAAIARLGHADRAAGGVAQRQQAEDGLFSGDRQNRRRRRQVVGGAHGADKGLGKIAIGQAGPGLRRQAAVWIGDGGYPR